MSPDNRAAPPRPQNTFDIGKVKRNFPQQLQKHGKFCYWTYKQRDDRWTKLPLQSNGRGASSADPDQWMSFSDAVTMRKKRTGDGIGILLYGGGGDDGDDGDGGCNLSGIDIDHCAVRDESGRIQLTYSAAQVCTAMDTYTELSPSGSGVHLLFYVDQNFNFDRSRWMIRKKIPVDGKAESGEMECYSSLWSPRYFTVTGEKLDLRDYGGVSSGELRNCTDVLPDILDEFMAVEASSGDDPHADQTAISETSQEAAPPVTDTERREAPPQQIASPAAPVQQSVSSQLTDSEIIDKMLASNPDAKVLWNGNISKYGGDDSKADEALCCHMTFWTQDPDQMDRIFRRSALMREKWNRQDYRERTIAKALASCKNHYDPKYRSRKRSSGPSMEFGWTDTIGSPGDRDPDGQEAAPAAEASSSVSVSDGGSTGQTQERSDPEYQVFPDEPTGDVPYLDSGGKWHMPLKWSKQRKLDFASWLTDHPDAVHEPYQYDGQMRWPRDWTEDDQTVWSDEHNLRNPHYRPPATPAVFQEHSSGEAAPVAAASSSGSESSSSGFCVYDPLEDNSKADQLPEFPLNVLPETMRDFARAASESAQVPDDMTGNAVLSAVSIATNGNFYVRVPMRSRREDGSIAPAEESDESDLYEWSNLYTMVEALPGERKSSVLKLITGHIVEREEQYEEETATERGSILSEIKVLRKRKDLLEDRASKAEHTGGGKESEETEDQEEAGEVISDESFDSMTRYLTEAGDVGERIQKLSKSIPVEPLVFVTDTTSEGLITLCDKHYNRMAIVAEEGQIVKTMTGMYSTNGQTNTDVYKNGYNGEPTRYVRQGKEVFGKLRLAILFMVQPSIADQMISNKDFSGEGLIQRFAFVDASSRSLVGKRRTADSIAVPKRVKDAFWSRVDPLLRDLMDPPEEATEVKMSAAALKKFIDYRDNIVEYRVGRYQKDGLSLLSQWSDRLSGKALRAALILHVYNSMTPADDGGKLYSCRAGSSGITGEEMEAGITIAEYWHEHSAAVINQTAARDSEDVEKAKVLWQYISEYIGRTGEDQVAVSYIQKNHRRKFPKRELMDDALDVLVDHGYIKLERVRRDGGTRPTEMIVVNPEAEADAEAKRQQVAE